MLKLRSGYDVEFEPEKGLKFTPFKVEPKKVTPALYFPTDNKTPKLLVCGDAQLAPDYRQGHGVESGINRAEAFLTSLSVIPGQAFVLNEKKFTQFLSGPQRTHEDLLNSRYTSRKSEINTGLETSKKIYLTALTLCKTAEEKNIVQIGLNAIYLKTLVKLYKDNKSKLSELARERNIKMLEETKKELAARKEQMIEDFIRSEKRKKESEESLESKEKKESVESEESVESKEKKESVESVESKEKKESVESVESKLARSTLIDLAKTYKSLAGELFKIQNYVAAKQYYKDALDIYTKHFPGQFLDDEVRINSNLAIVAAKGGKNYDEIVLYANSALKLISEHSLNLDKSLVNKIKFNLCLGLLNKIDLSLSKSNPNLEEHKEAFNHAQSLFKEINNEDSGVSKLDIKQLQDKLMPLEKKLLPQEAMQNITKY